jgi:hypothetical protein
MRVRVVETLTASASELLVTVVVLAGFLLPDSSVPFGLIWIRTRGGHSIEDGDIETIVKAE